MEIFYKLLESAKADKINGIDRKMRLLWLTIGREPQFKPLSDSLEYATKYEEYFTLVAKNQSQMNMQEILTHTGEVQNKVGEVLDMISTFCTKNKKKLKVTTITQTKDIDNLLSHS
ncbi:hypothetical protein FDI21_gp114 [Pseudomonas phage Noxifer]|uniref:Uncharacterized protein n=1 Tax=Pseudomonas phage Noxifer TaxID=2006684 RepID=A0A1Y0SZR8_9CAUD|nr:hypothetical protein FDI21_gp114 [Pseudomonas phage Noxifer]ARV77283.1 hypothetical protein NOXIFER_114 [Pseudomonas phage Noxifer]